MTNVKPVRLSFRAQMGDFPRERLKELEPFNGNPVDEDNLDDFGDFKSLEEAFAELHRAIESTDAKAGNGTCFEDIAKEIDVESLNLPHYQELA